MVVALPFAPLFRNRGHDKGNRVGDDNSKYECDVVRVSPTCAISPVVVAN